MNKKTYRLQILMTDKERSTLLSTAEARGTTPSELMRSLLREAATQTANQRDSFEAQQARVRRVYADALEWLYKQSEAGNENATKILMGSGREAAEVLGLAPEGNEVTK